MTRLDNIQSISGNTFKQPDRPARNLISLAGNLIVKTFLTAFFIHSFLFLRHTHQPGFLYLFLLLTVLAMISNMIVAGNIIPWDRTRKLKLLFNRKNEIAFYTRIFLITIFTSLISVAHARYFLLQTYQVNQKSMLPGIKPGEVILVEKISMGLITNYHMEGKTVRRIRFPWNRPVKPGDIIIFHKPANINPQLPGVFAHPGLTGKTEDNMESPPDDILIKRVADIKNNKYCVVGDNLENSTDSRDFGCIGENKIIGRFIHKLTNHDFNSPDYSKNGSPAKLNT